MTNPYAPLEPEVPREYLPPPSAYGPAVERFTLENDPLVNDTVIAGVGGWFTKLFAVIRRSWKLLLPIFLITHLVPSLITAMLGLGIGAAAMSFSRSAAEVGGAVLLLVVVLLPLILVAMSVGYAAATYAATREAAGLPVGLAEALRYGLRRCLGLTGWLFLTGLLVGGVIVIVSFCALSVLNYIGVLIALPLTAYGLMASSMVGPVYLFERQGPIRRSFQLLHAAFGKMFGRLLLVALTFLIGSAVEQAFTSGVNQVGAVGETLAVATVIGMVISAAVQLPLTIIQFAGILVTYAERRGDEGATTTDLVNSL